MRRQNSRLASLLFVCVCSILMTTMLISVNFYGMPDIGPNSGFRNVHIVMPNQETLIEIGLLGNGELGNSNKLISLAQLESCQKNCNLSIAVSKSGKLPTWAHRTLLNTTQKTKYVAFRQTISALEYDQMMELLTVFNEVFAQHNLTYFLYGGTLLGAYRHFGLVPWDDDIDVMMNGSQRLQIKTILSRIPGYSIDTPRGRQWKFYKHSRDVSLARTRQNNSMSRTVEMVKSNESRELDNVTESVAQDKQFHHETTTATNVMWPYIDIFFFDENTTHVWDDNPSYKSTYCFHKTDVFPLTSMQFESRLLPVPRNTRTFLATSYNVDLCVTSTYSHKYETHVKQRQVSLPCRRLFKYVPFVFRMCSDEFSFEQLVINGIQIYATILKC